MACALSAGVAVPAAAQLALHGAPVIERDSAGRDTAFVEAVVQVNIDHGPSAVVPALEYNSSLLLPLHRFLDLVEIRVAAFALGDSAVAVLEPGGVPLRFVPRAGVLTRGGERVPYDTADVAWSDGDLFVATGLLDRLLGLNTEVDWENLAVVVGHTGALPVVERERRERRHQLLYRPPPPVAALDLPLRQRTVDGAVFSWSVTAATSGPTDQVSADFGIGAGLLGGSAELRPQMWSSYGTTGVQLQASWTRAWTGSSWIRQARLGDVQTNGLHSMLIDGAVITNAPYIRSSEFDIEPIIGTVPPGWEAELYEGSRLLGYADANTLGAFQVPLQLRYGENPFNLVLYGPSGEMVQQKHTIRVPTSRLPGGDFEYALAAGRCQYDPCDGVLSADFRYGLSSRVTVQGGSDGHLRPQGALWQPYAVISAAATPALGFTGEAVVNGHLRAAADYAPSEDLHATATATRFAPAGAAFSGAGAETSEMDGSVFWRPGWMRGALYFNGTGLVSVAPGLRQVVQRLSATTQVGAIRYSLGALYNTLSLGAAGTTPGFAIDASADAIVTGGWKWLRAANVGAQLGFEPGRGLSALRASVGRRITELLRVDAALGWFREGGVSLELGLTTAARGPQAGTRSRFSQTGSQGLTYSSGSLAWDPRSSLLKFGDGADLERAGVSGVVFRDDNGNGVQDPGEPGLAGIPVSVGGYAAKTDSSGRFSVWGLLPWESVRVNVDTLALPDPHLLLPAPVLRVRPAPNAFGEIRVPVVTGAEVSGFVVMGDRALAGVPVILHELDTDHVITLRTFADGAFYREAVPPGDYEVTLPNDVLDRLKAYAPPLSIFVPPGPEEKRFADLELRLEPRQ